MASDHRTKRRWNIDAPHQTSMDCNSGRFVPVDLLVGAGECGFLWVSFRCGQHVVVSNKHSWIRVTLHKYIAMIMSVPDGTDVGDVSSPSSAMWCVCVIQSVRNRVAYLFYIRGSGLNVVAHVALMASGKYAKHTAMTMLVQTSTDIGDDSSFQCRCDFLFFSKTIHEGRLLL